jgi:hypothetical protein
MTPPTSIEAVEVEMVMTEPDDAMLRFVVKGTDLLLPEWKSPGRADGLWASTCFELFLRPMASQGYFEFNFSPSTQWAAYAFAGYREGRGDLPFSVEPVVVREPEVEPRDRGSAYVIEVDVDFSDLSPNAHRMGLCAVIEEMSGRKSYWALAHPPGDKPDFHDPACFTLELPAAGMP